MPELTALLLVLLLIRNYLNLKRARRVGELWKTCALSQEREMDAQLDLLAVDDDRESQLAAIRERIDDAFDEGLYAREDLEAMGENHA